MSKGNVNIVVLHIDDLDEKIVKEIGAETVRRWRKEGDVWLIVKGREVLSRHQTKEEAERRAELFKLADKIVNDVREYAVQRFRELTEEQVRAIRDYLGRMDIVIPIQRQPPGEVREYEIDLYLFGKPAWELEGLEGEDLNVGFADKLEALGEELNARLRFAARALRELLARGWTATGTLYSIILYKEATWEEVEADAKEIGIDLESIREVEEEEEIEGEEWSEEDEE